ncbi:MAG: histidine kinase [Nitrospira bacterium SG8_35_1]|nr:MAG: histidine kinase [Nitrospira bacterium SG8_35_1]
MMATVKQLLKSKENNIWSISPEATVFEGLQAMADKNIGALLVTKDDNLVGIFSERDYARKVILKGKASKDTTIGELMTREVVYITPENSLDECMALMSAKHIRHLPIISNGKLLGLLTLGDVVKEILSNQEFKIQEMEKYISGSL